MTVWITFSHPVFTVYFNKSDAPRWADEIKVTEKELKKYRRLIEKIDEWNNLVRFRRVRP